MTFNVGVVGSGGVGSTPVAIQLAVALGVLVGPGKIFDVGPNRGLVMSLTDLNEDLLVVQSSEIREESKVAKVLRDYCLPEVSFFNGEFFASERDLFGPALSRMLARPVGASCPWAVYDIGSGLGDFPVDLIGQMDICINVTVVGYKWDWIRAQSKMQRTQERLEERGWNPVEMYYVENCGPDGLNDHQRDWESVLSGGGSYAARRAATCEHIREFYPNDWERFLKTSIPYASGQSVLFAKGFPFALFPDESFLGRRFLKLAAEIWDKLSPPGGSAEGGGAGGSYHPRVADADCVAFPKGERCGEGA